jgi:hypothetical protein
MLTRENNISTPKSKVGGAAILSLKVANIFFMTWLLIAMLK